MSDSVRSHRRQPTRLPRPWDSPGKNTGVGCHFLLQCVKVKSESEVAQSYLTLQDPMDCSLPGSSIHGVFQARVLEWGAIAFSGESSLDWAKKTSLCLVHLSNMWIEGRISLGKVWRTMFQIERTINPRNVSYKQACCLRRRNETKTSILSCIYARAGQAGTFCFVH